MTRATHIPANVAEAVRTAGAWCNRWAEHVGSCHGAEQCTCGLTRVRWELYRAVQELDKSE